MMKLTYDIIISFKEYLIDNDKCVYTIDKYIRDVMKFKEYVCDCEIEKEDGDEDGICDNCGEEITPDADCDKNGHVDSDNDGVCDNCGDVMPEVKNCKCICHKKGFAGFIYKIIRFLWKLFGMKKVCDCGLSHY